MLEYCVSSVKTFTGMEGFTGICEISPSNSAFFVALGIGLLENLGVFAGESSVQEAIAWGRSSVTEEAAVKLRVFEEVVGTLVTAKGTVRGVEWVRYYTENYPHVCEAVEYSVRVLLSFSIGTQNVCVDSFELEKDLNLLTQFSKVFSQNIIILNSTGMTQFLVSESNRENPLISLYFDGKYSLLYHQTKLDVLSRNAPFLGKYPFTLDPLDVPDDLLKHFPDHVPPVFPTQINKLFSVLIQNLSPSTIPNNDLKRIHSLVSNIAREDPQILQIYNEFHNNLHCAHNSGNFTPSCGLTHCKDCLQQKVENNLNNPLCLCGASLSHENVDEILEFNIESDPSFTCVLCNHKFEIDLFVDCDHSTNPHRLCVECREEHLSEDLKCPFCVEEYNKRTLLGFVEQLKSINLNVEECGVCKREGTVKGFCLLCGLDARS